MTEIVKVSTNYNVSNESGNLKMGGTFVFTEKIDSMSLTVYSGTEFIGNVFYSEYEDGTVSYNVPKQYAVDVFNLLQAIINDVYIALTE